MLPALVLLVVCLTAADHWTTYLCLRAPVAGWEVTEANPIAQWLFGSTGLVPGLVIDTAITLAAIGALLASSLFGRAAKQAFLGFIALSTGYAVANNLQAIERIGISAVGW